MFRLKLHRLETEAHRITGTTRPCWQKQLRYQVTTLYLTCQFLFFIPLFSFTLIRPQRTLHPDGPLYVPGPQTPLRICLRYPSTIHK